MKIKVINERRNELLKRNEVTFQVDHEGSGTPSRIEVRQKLAGVLRADEERVYVKKFETRTGSMIAVGEASVYDSVDQAKYVEPEHITVRNAPISKEKE
ncbi:MAG: 30S ribosomal protein S24e [Candidatus Bathyarchaeia archaeon]